MQPRVLVVPFATVTDGCKELNFNELFHECDNLESISLSVVICVLNLLENSMKFNSLLLSVTVAKGKQSFANVAHGCKAVTIYRITLKLEKPVLFMNLAKYKKTLIFPQAIFKTS